MEKEICCDNHRRMASTAAATAPASSAATGTNVGGVSAAPEAKKNVFKGFEDLPEIKGAVSSIVVQPSANPVQRAKEDKILAMIDKEIRVELTDGRVFEVKFGIHCSPFLFVAAFIMHSFVTLCVD